MITISVHPCPLCGENPTVNIDKDGLPTMVYCTCHEAAYSFARWQEISEYAYNLLMGAR